MAAPQMSDAVYASKLQDAENGNFPTATAVPVNTTTYAGQVVGGSGTTNVMLAPEQTTVVVTRPQRYSATGVHLPNGGQPFIGEGVTPDEAIALNYRYSVRCFAFLDLFLTILNVFTATGWYRYVSLVLAIGPLNGYSGAAKLDRCAVGVYLAFCYIKLIWYLLVSFATFSIVGLLIALVQLWITKIVHTFWKAIGTVALERRRQIIDPNFQVAEVRFVYW